jgi:sigma-E factor negative regulatory protein RseB
VTRRPVLSGRTGLVLAMAMLATCTLVRSSDAVSAGAVPGTDPQAQALLQRAVEAENATRYQGVEFMSVDDDAVPVGAASAGTAADETTAVVDVTHLPGQGTVLVEDADNGTPGRAAFSAALSGADSSRPNLLLGLLGQTYRLELGTGGLVAGRYAEQVVARRADGSVAARFWTDAATGLLLRRDVLSPDGRLVRMSEFVQLALTAAAPRHLPVMLPALAGQSLSDSDLDGWRSRGWPCARVLGGLSLFDARSEPGSAGPVLHLSYSDGLSTVSVFLQPGRLDPAGLAATSVETVGGEPVWVRSGVPREMVWSSRGYVITVVADAPHATVTAVVASLPHGVEATGGWARVERGVARVMSWLNPFN